MELLLVDYGSTRLWHLKPSAMQECVPTVSEGRSSQMGQRKGRDITALALIASQERRRIAGFKVDHLHPHQ